MSAALKDGQTFSGPYLQVTSTTRSQDFDPLWTGWEYGWGGWGGFGPFPGTAFTTHYSGRVMANLQAAAGRASASSKAAARWMLSSRPQRRTSTATLNT